MKGKNTTKILNIMSIVLLTIILFSDLPFNIFGFTFSRVSTIIILIISGLILLIEGSLKSILRILDLKDKRKWIWVNALSAIFGVLLLGLATWSIFNIQTFNSDLLSTITIIISLILTLIETFI